MRGGRGRARTRGHVPHAARRLGILLAVRRAEFAISATDMLFPATSASNAGIRASSRALLPVGKLRRSVTNHTVEAP
ncbi:MAG: hypothetical protein ACLTMP_08430 [Eggerthella lenta]